jgi:hypothetical protein
MHLERELQRNPLKEIGTEGNSLLTEIRILDYFKLNVNLEAVPAVLL